MNVNYVNYDMPKCYVSLSVAITVKRSSFKYEAIFSVVFFVGMSFAFSAPLWYDISTETEIASQLSIPWTPTRLLTESFLCRWPSIQNTSVVVYVEPHITHERNALCIVGLCFVLLIQESLLGKKAWIMTFYTYILIGNLNLFLCILWWQTWRYSTPNFEKALIRNRKSNPDTLNMILLISCAVQSPHRL